MKLLRLASLVSIVLSIGGQAGLASPLGLWQAKDGAKIKIESCGQSLCGFIAQISPSHDPVTGQLVKDKNNVDHAKRNRPLVGVQVLISMQPNGASKWSGQVYNDDNGRTYSGNLIELGPSTIRIEGCWLMICDGEELVRVK